MNIFKLAMIFGAVGLLMSPSLKADSVSFDFNSLANGAGNSSVQSYMNGVLGAAGSVVVAGSQASNSYNGDGHVVGPGTGSTSLTLATSDGTMQHLNTTDTFIDNVSSATEISMTFSGLKIYGVSFDYEIFPDGTCPTGNNCGSNYPDFTFSADGTVVFNKQAVMPGNPGAPYIHSPASGPSGTELAPQFLGQSGTWTFPNGVTKLEFIDWPATIGIDNLQINTATPEPATLTLIGVGMLGLAGARRRLLKK
jgi:PEP-CTERM motif